MGFTRENGICASWFIAPTPLDLGNLDLSGVGRVMLGYSLAVSNPQIDVPGQPQKEGLLHYLRRTGRSVIVRLAREDVLLGGDIPMLVSALSRINSQVQLERVIICNEPDNPYDLTQSSPNWGDQPKVPAEDGKVHTIQEHRAFMVALITALEGALPAVGLVAPASSCRTPRPTAPPQPGELKWNRELYLTYKRCHGGTAMHVYTDNSAGYTDLERLEWVAQWKASLWEPPYTIDELGIRNGTEHDRVTWYLNFCAALTSGDMQQAGHLGALVDTVIFFCWTGAPGGGGWDAGYLIKDPDSFRRIRRFRETGEVEQ